MAEGSELMNRLMSENADLKKQVRLMKENQMLKRLLSESCQESCGRGGRDFLFPKAPAYPEACSPGSTVPDFGRFTSGPDAPSQLQGSSLEDLLCSHAPLSSEDDASPGCVTSSQVPFKAFLSSPELRASRGSDRKLSPLLSPLQDPLVEKTLLETREVGRPKKVCFSESSLPSGDRTRRSYYLNEIQSFTGTEKDGRIVGEIAFQLDRRILAYVFPGVTRLYGFTVSNIPEKIKQAPFPGSGVGAACSSVSRSALEGNWPPGGGLPLGLSVPIDTAVLGGHRDLAPGLRLASPSPRVPGPAAYSRLCPQTSIKSLDGSVDEKKLRELTHRYLTLTARLERLGYNRDVHPVFSEFLINTYGILKQRPDLRANPLHSSPAALRKLVIDVVPPKFLGDSLLLLNCLCELSKEDSRPLFAW
ncbi:hypothetical protein MG293_000109 [Ovis ammon polii]|uniref:Speriolin-like protein n=1 Tax=Ovis ammon polii TaxID=230172 RepID=A0AAD4YGV7_OVIAM|nr:hypothetical protein MG293_000109 [Ovis ammon polii]KAI4578716.1 hypothetical protein MJT46_000084 [Ovis ammon polii x Ovis aries]